MNFIFPFSWEWKIIPTDEVIKFHPVIQLGVSYNGDTPVAGWFITKIIITIVCNQPAIIFMGIGSTTNQFRMKCGSHLFGTPETKFPTRSSPGR